LTAVNHTQLMDNGQLFPVGDLAAAVPSVTLDGAEDRWLSCAERFATEVLRKQVPAQV
jgi:hypothetical protein